MAAPMQGRATGMVVRKRNSKRLLVWKLTYDSWWLNCLKFGICYHLPISASLASNKPMNIMSFNERPMGKVAQVLKLFQGVASSRKWSLRICRTRTLRVRVSGFRFCASSLVAQQTWDSTKRLREISLLAFDYQSKALEIGHMKSMLCYFCYAFVMQFDNLDLDHLDHVFF